MNYQQKAWTFAAYDENVEYPFLALGEEAGEVLGKVAKFVRKNNVSASDAILAAAKPQTLKDQELRDNLISELGDVLWQLAACATELSVTLEDIQNFNIAKLSGREVRGTIVGEGDNR